MTLVQLPHVSSVYSVLLDLGQPNPDGSNHQLMEMNDVRSWIPYFIMVSLKTRLALPYFIQFHYYQELPREGKFLLFL